MLCSVLCRTGKLRTSGNCPRLRATVGAGRRQVTRQSIPVIFKIDEVLSLAVVDVPVELCVTRLRYAQIHRVSTVEPSPRSAITDRPHGPSSRDSPPPSRSAAPPPVDSAHASSNPGQQDEGGPADGGRSHGFMSTSTVVWACRILLTRYRNCQPDHHRTPPSIRK